MGRIDDVVANREIVTALAHRGTLLKSSVKRASPDRQNHPIRESDRGGIVTLDGS
jgi:hypothetical protein